MTYQMTESTTRILKNFAAISPSVILQEGTTQRTVSSTKSVLAIADFKDAWPKTTPIYALPDLLANLSAYQSPTLTFDDTQFVIRSANSPSHVEYPYSAESVIAKVPQKDFDLTNPQAVFTLPDTALAEIKKFAAINTLPVVSIVADGSDKTIVVKPYDDKNASSRVYSYPVSAASIATIEPTCKVKVTIRTEHLNLILDGAYTVTLGAWNYIYLQHQTEKLSYFMAIMPPKH